VRDGQGRQWFATVDDLDDKCWLGDTRAAVSKGLRAAMDTAFALRHHAGLRFVVAPVPALDGETVLPLGSKYAVTVFPFMHGASGRFGEELPAANGDSSWRCWQRCTDPRQQRPRHPDARSQCRGATF